MGNIIIKVTTVILIMSISISAFLLFRSGNFRKYESREEEKHTGTIEVIEPWEKAKRIEIERLLSGNDKDADGIDDLEDIIQGARVDVKNRSEYKDAYYRGGYPPENEGVCTDVIWRAFRNSGFELKDLLDTDIKSHTSEYKRVTDREDLTLILTLEEYPIS